MNERVDADNSFAANIIITRKVDVYTSVQYSAQMREILKNKIKLLKPWDKVDKYSLEKLPIITLNPSENIYREPNFCPA